MEQILVVEDDWELNHGICWQLQKEAYDTKAAYCADVVAKGNFSTGFAGCESSGWRRIFGIAVDESGKSTYTGSFSYGKGSGRRCPAGI